LYIGYRCLEHHNDFSRSFYRLSLAVITFFLSDSNSRLSYAYNYIGTNFVALTWTDKGYTRYKERRQLLSVDWPTSCSCNEKVQVSCFPAWRASRRFQASWRYSWAERRIWGDATHSSLPFILQGQFQKWSRYDCNGQIFIVFNDKSSLFFCYTLLKIKTFLWTRDFLTSHASSDNFWLEVMTVLATAIKCARKASKGKGLSERTNRYYLGSSCFPEKSAVSWRSYRFVAHTDYNINMIKRISINRVKKRPSISEAWLFGQNIFLISACVYSKNNKITNKKSKQAVKISF